MSQDSTLLNLTEATELDGSEFLYGVKSSQDKKISLNTIKDFIGVGSNSIFVSSLDPNAVGDAINSLGPITPTPEEPQVVVVGSGNHVEVAFTLSIANFFLYLEPGATLSFTTGGIVRNAKNIKLIGGKTIGTGSNVGPLITDTEFTGNVGAVLNYLNFDTYTGPRVTDYDDHLIKDMVVENPTGVALGNIYGKTRNVQSSGTKGIQDGWGTDMDSACKFTGSIYGGRVRTLIFTNPLPVSHVPPGDINPDGSVADYYNSNNRVPKTGGAKFEVAIGFPDAVAFHGWAESNQTGFLADPTYGDPGVNAFIVWPPEINGSYFKAPEGHYIDNADGHYLGGGVSGCGDYTGCKIMGINPILRAEGHFYFSGGNITNNFVDGSLFVKYMANAAITDSILNFNSVGNDRVGTVAEFSRFVRCTAEGTLVLGAPSVQRYFEDCTDVANGDFGWKRRDLAIYMHLRSTSQYVEVSATTDYATAAGTVEFDFKVNGTTRGDFGFCSHNNIGGGVNVGWSIFGDPTNNWIYCRVGNNTAILAMTVNCWNSAWHRLAVSWSGTTARVFLDGIFLVNGVSAAPTSVARRLIIGGVGNNVNLSTTLDTAGLGMIRNWSFSNSNRYNADVNYPVLNKPIRDTNHLTRYGQVTNGAMSWEDEYGLHNAITGGGVVETLTGTPILWVPDSVTPAV